MNLLTAFQKLIAIEHWCEAISWFVPGVSGPDLGGGCRGCALLPEMKLSSYFPFKICLPHRSVKSFLRGTPPPKKNPGSARPCVLLLSIIISVVYIHDSSIDIAMVPSRVFAVSSDNAFSVLKNSINSEPFGFVSFVPYICFKKRSSSSTISFGSVNFL